MSDMFSSMMHNPWFYVALMGGLILLTLGMLFAIRMLARHEVRGGSRDDDPHLG